MFHTSIHHNNMETVTIIILDYCSSEVDIIHQAPKQIDNNNYEQWLSTHCDYNPLCIAYMIVPSEKGIVPNHFTPDDFN